MISPTTRTSTMPLTLTVVFLVSLATDALISWKRSGKKSDCPWGGAWNATEILNHISVTPRWRPTSRGEVGGWVEKKYNAENKGNVYSKNTQQK